MANVPTMFTADLIEQVQHFGRAAKIVDVLGRRSGFNSLTILQDVCEYLGTSVDTFTALTGAENLEVVSSDANDTSAGTGAQKVWITYIDNTGAIATVQKTMNGVTPVAMGTGFKSILCMEADPVGSNSVAVGNLDVRLVGGGGGAATIFERISAGGNRSLSGKYMVPTGYMCHVIDFNGGSKGTTQDMRLRAQVNYHDRSLSTAYHFLANKFIGDGGSFNIDQHSAVIPEGARIKVSTLPGAAGSSNRCDCGVTLLLHSMT